MTHIGKGRAWVGGILLAISLGILLAEIAMHMYMAYIGKHYDNNHWVIFVAFVIGFGGWFTLAPKSAKEGGQFMVDNGVKVLSAIRLGRRKSDAMKVVKPDTATEEIAIPIAIEPDPPGSPQRRSTDPAPKEEEHPNG